MIILEGPDGSGKTTLLEEITSALDIGQAPRASDSLTGVAGRDLKQWVDEDLSTWHKRPCEVYDRHPIIGEIVYGAILRGVPTILLNGWYRQHLATFQRSALVIFCLPRRDTVVENVFKDETAQMPGVQENIDAIYSWYTWMAMTWSGHHYSYDYEQSHRSLPNILARAKSHKESWYV